MGFPRQEDWSGYPFPSPGDFPDPGIEPTSFALAGGFFTTELPGKLKEGIPKAEVCNLYPASLVAQLVKNPPAMQETWV